MHNPARSQDRTQRPAEVEQNSSTPGNPAGTGGQSAWVVQLAWQTVVVSPGYTGTQAEPGPHCSELEQTRYADTVGQATPPTVSHAAIPPVGAQAERPSQKRRPQNDPGHCASLVQGAQAVMLAAQSAGLHAHRPGHVPVAGPVQAAFTRTQVLVAPHHPHPANGEHVPQLVAVEQSTVAVTQAPAALHTCPAAHPGAQVPEQPSEPHERPEQLGVQRPASLPPATHWPLLHVRPPVQSPHEPTPSLLGPHTRPLHRLTCPPSATTQSVPVQGPQPVALMAINTPNAINRALNCTIGRLPELDLWSVLRGELYRIGVGRRGNRHLSGGRGVE